MSHVMPDFTERLEEQLRSAAITDAPPRRHRATPRRGGIVLRHRRLAASFALCLVLALCVVVAGGLDDRRTPTAYGKPLVLLTPTVDASRDLKGGLATLLAFGPGAQLDQAHPIQAFGGTAYVLSGPKGWCLSAPDPGAADPAREGGVTCTPNASFLRYGIALRVGSNFIAALPQGVRKPTVRLPDGTTRELTPSDDQGVVTAENLPTGAVVTTFSVAGAPRSMSVD
jgi:hypothetical protein